jgi:hypothetical protein
MHTLRRCEEKTVCCVVSVGYYLIENRIGGENTGLIIDRFIKLSVRACKMKLWRIHTTITQVRSRKLLLSVTFFKMLISFSNVAGNVQFNTD